MEEPEVEAAPPPEAVAAADTTPPTPRLPWVLVALLLASTIAMTALWLSARTTDEAAVRGAAITFMTELTTWDAGVGLDQTTDRLRELGTGAFLDEVDEVLGTEIQATAEALGATSAGEVTEVIVDGQVAIVFVRQTLSVSGITESQEQIARLVFVEVDGEWKVEVVELLNAPVPLQEGQP